MSFSVGSGTITTGSDVTDLNRNTNESMLITKNERAGGLDYVITVDNKDLIATGKGVYGLKFAGEAFAKYDDIINEYKNTDNPNGYLTDPRYDEFAHQKAAEQYGAYVGNPFIAGTFRTIGEVGQFFYYSADDLTRLVITGKNGSYQPYKFSDKNGGLIDSWNDIGNVINGANGNSNPEFYKPKDNLKSYNDATFGKE